MKTLFILFAISFSNLFYANNSQKLLPAKDDLSPKSNFVVQKKDTLITVVCDLTLEDPKQISKVITDAKKILSINGAEKMKFVFYVLDNHINGSILQYQRPKSKYPNPKTLSERKLKALENQKFKKEKNEYINSLGRKLQKLYEEEFKDRVSIARSCHFRALSTLSKTIAYNSTEEDYKILIFLSDLVEKCDPSICGEKLFFTTQSEENASKIIESCETDTDLSGIDKIVVIESATYNHQNPNAIRPERIHKLWRQALAKFQYPKSKSENLMITAEIPSQLFW